ncbi:response regulator transcription factor [Anaerolentibacter hominis]|uniref:response regulator transcription factor n=1 Tax=Anaerolentibacter hominis TaxID=3079009 RepID=UPI0031B8311C
MQTKGTILIADDDDRIRRMLKDFLTIKQYAVIEAANGEEALDLFYANSNSVDLILLDVMMPIIDGFEVLTDLRHYSQVPVIMLTAKGEEYDQLNGFKCGADDYIPKPFLPSVLLAHIEAVLKRTRLSGTDVFAGKIKIQPAQHRIWMDDKQLTLTPKEYDLLLYLVQHENLVLSRETILNSVWGIEYEGDLRTVDTHIKQLRSKLSSCNYIKTVHGIGYQFEVVA